MAARIESHLKTESPNREEAKIPEEKATNEVHIKFAGGDENGGELDIAIKTDLTNLNKEEEIPALNSLAMEIRLKTEEKEKVEEPAEIPIERKPKFKVIPTGGKITIISEEELDDWQLEITAGAPPICKKPEIPTIFSMRFSKGAGEPSEPEKETKKEPAYEDIIDLEELSEPENQTKKEPAYEDIIDLEELSEPENKTNRDRGYEDIIIDLEELSEPENESNKDRGYEDIIINLEELSEPSELENETTEAPGYEDIIDLEELSEHSELENETNEDPSYEDIIDLEELSEPENETIKDTGYEDIIDLEELSEPENETRKDRGYEDIIIDLD